MCTEIHTHTVKNKPFHNGMQKKKLNELLEDGISNNSISLNMNAVTSNTEKYT